MLTIVCGERSKYNSKRWQAPNCKACPHVLNLPSSLQYLSNFVRVKRKVSPRLSPLTYPREIFTELPFNPILVGPFVPPYFGRRRAKMPPPPLEMSLKTKCGKNPEQKSIRPLGVHKTSWSICFLQE